MLRNNINEISFVPKNDIKITTPTIIEKSIGNKGKIEDVVIIDYGNSHLIYGGKDLGSMEELAKIKEQLYWYKREYRYLLNIYFGIIKNNKKALQKKYKKDLELLNSWYEAQKQEHIEKLRGVNNENS